jgi:RND family efflux transporter MFP subunit
VKRLSTSARSTLIAALVLVGALALPLAPLALTSCARLAPAEPAPAPAAEAAVPALRVRAAEVVSEPLAEGPSWTGLVQFERKVRLSPEVPGRVVERKVDRGDRVRKGAVLLRLDDYKIGLEAERARIAREAAEHQAAFAETELARAESLGDALSPQAVDQARHGAQMAADGLAQARIVEKTAEQALRDTRLKAPFSGIVAERFADVGDTVAPGVPLFVLVSVDPALVRVGVSAAEAARLEPGQAARVVFDDLGGATATAELVTVGQLPDPMTGTYPADYRVPNSDGDLREGMVAALLAEITDQPVVQIPRQALVEQAGGPAVYVVEVGGPSGNTARLRPVRLGRQGSQRAEVLSGVEAGQEVVVEGQFALVDGMPIDVER